MVFSALSILDKIICPSLSLSPSPACVVPHPVESQSPPQGYVEISFSADHLCF